MEVGIDGSVAGGFGEGRDCVHSVVVLQRLGGVNRRSGEPCISGVILEGTGSEHCHFIYVLGNS